MKMIPAIVMTLAMMLCTSWAAASNETVFIQQNFGDKTLFKLTEISPTVRAAGTGGVWNGFDNANFSIVDIVGDQDGRALKIARVKSGILSVSSLADVPNNRTITVRMRVRVGPKDESAGVIRFFNQKRNTIVANVRFEGNNSVAGYLDGKRYFGLKTRPEEWQEITFRFSPNAERFDLAVEYADGKTLQGTPVPFENNVPIDAIEFATYPATNEGGDNTILIDDINVAYENTSSLSGRDNVLSSAYNTRAFIIAADGTRRESSRLNDGVVNSTSVEAVAGFPSVLQFDLSQSTLVSTVRLFTGNADYLDNPSGEVAVTAFMVEGMSSASGQWRELLTVNDVPGFRAAGAKDNESFYITCDFEPLEVSQLRVTLLDSNDTGQRAEAGEKVIKTTLVREVELYTHEATAGRRKQLATVLNAEFALPAYRDEKIAQLHASLSDDLPDGIEVEVSVRDRQTGHVPETARRVKLTAGEARIDFDIAGWPDGEYRVQLQAAGLEAPVGGTLARLLRINRLDASAVPTDLGDFSGKRMFFPDARNLASQSNIDIRQGHPQVHRVGRTFLKPGKVVQLGSDIGFTSDGKLAVIFRDMDREWKAESSEVHYAMADLTNLDKWEIHDGKPTDIDTTSAGLMNRRVRIGRGVDLTPDDMQRMRFYDPATDGPVDLKALHVQYAGYKKADWGVMQPPPQSTWLLWKKGNEWLILQNKPFLQDNLSAEEFELSTNSNDNFAGQWLSDDGKTFFYVRGRLLKRYPPFVARYDNLWQAARILTVFTTNDGLTWRQQYFPLPTEENGPTAQHYGAHIREVPNSNGLMISYTLFYSALMQQMHLELDYSWDGKSWYRSPGGEPWVPPGQPDEWNFGLTNLHEPVIERNGLSYHLIGWGAEIPHFGGEILFKPAEMEKLSGAYLQQRYGERGLADWPFFKHYGSFNRLAESLRGYGITPGVMVYRTDGWWALSASGDEGSFTTLPLRAKESLTANARIAADGYIAITLTDRDGVPINGYSVRLTASDSATLPVFEHLPTDEFHVSVTLKNAELFTLNF